MLLSNTPLLLIQRIKLFFVFLIMQILWLNQAYADQIFLKNGDVITGKVVKKETEKLVFSTNYAGKIEIAWDDIQSLNTDDPQKVMLSDGTLAKGKIEQSDAESMQLVSDDGTDYQRYDLNQVKYINPSPALSGEGYVWSGHINAGATVTSGNSDIKSANVDVNSIARSLNDRYLLGGLFFWTQDSGIKTQSNTRVNAQYDRFFTKRWYGYTNASFENDRFRDIRLRSIYGLGSGYQLFETPDLNLSLEGGLNYVTQDYYEETDENYPALRWAVKYNQAIFNSIKLFHQDEVLYGLGNDGQILVSTETGLRFPLVFNFNATTQLNYNWDSHPADGSSKRDARLLLTLGYAW